MCVGLAGGVLGQAATGGGLAGSLARTGLFGVGGMLAAKKKPAQPDRLTALYPNGG